MSKSVAENLSEKAFVKDNILFAESIMKVELSKKEKSEFRLLYEKIYKLLKRDIELKRSEIL